MILVHREKERRRGHLRRGRERSNQGPAARGHWCQPGCGFLFPLVWRPNRERVFRRASGGFVFREIFSGVSKRSFAILKLLSGYVGGRQRSSAQKKLTELKDIFRDFDCSTTEARNFCVMRLPDSATSCDAFMRLAVSISSSQAFAAAAREFPGPRS